MLSCGSHDAVPHSHGWLLASPMQTAMPWWHLRRFVVHRPVQPRSSTWNQCLALARSGPRSVQSPVESDSRNGEARATVDAMHNREASRLCLAVPYESRTRLGVPSVPSCKHSKEQQGTIRLRRRASRTMRTSCDTVRARLRCKMKSPVSNRTILTRVRSKRCWTAMSASSGLSQSAYRQNGTRSAAHDLLR